MILPLFGGFDYSNAVNIDKARESAKDQIANNALVDIGDKSITTTTTNTSENATLHYTSNPTISPTFTFTITDSEVADTGNSSYSLPTTFTPSMSQSATPSVTTSKSSGIDLTSIIVPVAGIAAVGAVAYLLLGNDKVKKTVEKKVKK